MAQSSNRVVRGFGIYEHLREHKPALVLANDGDGTITKINVPDVRNKFARVMIALRELAWVSCDLLDKKGGLLYRHQRNSDDRDQPAGELEDMPQTRAMAEVSGLLNIMLRAQETVLIRHQQAMQQVLDAQMRILDTAMKRLELQELQYEQAMRLNHALSSDLVNAQLNQLQLPAPTDEEGNPRPQSDRAIEALLPRIIASAVGGGDAPKNGDASKKNGVSEKKQDPKRQGPASSSPTE